MDIINDFVELVYVGENGADKVLKIIIEIFALIMDIYSYRMIPYHFLIDSIILSKIEVSLLKPTRAKSISVCVCQY